MNPPWVKYPNLPRTSMGWRMGAGEEYREEFEGWWVKQTGSQRAIIMTSYPEPATWAGFWKSLPNSLPPLPAMTAVPRKFHNHAYFLKHCEIVVLLANREDREHPVLKHHLRAAVREASNHVAFGPGNPKQSAEFMSLAAQKQMEEGCSEGLIAEHGVPVSRLNDLIVEEAKKGSLTVSDVASLLDKNTLRAVITAEEDRTLEALGYRKTMPEGSDELKARYIAAGIELVANRYAELLKGSMGGDDH